MDATYFLARTNTAETRRRNISATSVKAGFNGTIGSVSVRRSPSESAVAWYKTFASRQEYYDCASRKSDGFCVLSQRILSRTAVIREHGTNSPRIKHI